MSIESTRTEQPLWQVIRRVFRWGSHAPHRYHVMASLIGLGVGGGLGVALGGDFFIWSTLGGFVGDTALDIWWWRRTRPTLQRDPFGNPRS